MAYITISKTALFYNLNTLCKKLGSKERLSIVLKDNAYGHGLNEVATLANEFGIKRAIVRSYEEADQISNLFENIIILVPKFPHKPKDHYSLVVNDIKTLKELPKNSKIELKLDTGMHRNGLSAKEAEEAFIFIKKYDLHLSGVMTHFRSADVLSSELFWQDYQWQKLKLKILHLCKKYKLPKPLFHSANSATILRLNNYHDDFARCGIAIYGYHEIDTIYPTPDLKPVLNLFAEKISTRKINKNQRIGYGGSYMSDKLQKISTYDIGYGDGFFRFNGDGEFYLNTHQVLGKISMDSLCLEGEKSMVCILNNAKEIAKYFDTISYDVLVKLSPQIRRVIVD